MKYLVKILLEDVVAVEKVVLSVLLTMLLHPFGEEQLVVVFRENVSSREA